MDLDAVLLARLQFAFTIAFHILFPTLTIGLGGFLVLLEALWLKTGDSAYERLYKFWVKIFGLAFGMGVVTGVVLSYQIGTNFSRFSEVTGNLLGPLFSYEVLSAFFLEAGFIGIMLFGWGRVGRGLHFFATLMVVIGTLISAFWIIAANSWMQTPVGHVVIDGKVHAESWWQAVFNPSMPLRYAHMVLASYVSAMFVVAGVSAMHLLMNQHQALARRALAMAVVLAAIFAPAQVIIGDMSGLIVEKYQPMKLAAMEGRWDTMKGAPLILFALPSQARETNDYEIAIPKLASLIITHSWDGEVRGLKEVKPADRPYVPIVFWSFRIMVGIGTLMVAVALFGLWLLWRRTIAETRWFLAVLVAMMPLGFVATLAGWITAEVGRQPWVVYGLLRTADSVSPVAAGAVAASLGLFVLVYNLLLIAYLYYAYRVALRGPDDADTDVVIPRRPLAAKRARLQAS